MNPLVGTLIDSGLNLLFGFPLRNALLLAKAGCVANNQPLLRIYEITRDPSIACLVKYGDRNTQIWL
jgi:hypothetical protein